jgi:hypothetical protein
MRGRTAMLQAVFGGGEKPATEAMTADKFDEVFDI